MKTDLLGFNTQHLEYSCCQCPSGDAGTNKKSVGKPVDTAIHTLAVESVHPSTSSQQPKRLHDKCGVPT